MKKDVITSFRTRCQFIRDSPCSLFGKLATYPIPLTTPPARSPNARRIEPLAREHKTDYAGGRKFEQLKQFADMAIAPYVLSNFFFRFHQIALTLVVQSGFRDQSRGL